MNEISGAALQVYLVHYEAADWVRSAARSVLASDINVDLRILSNSGALEVEGAPVIDLGRNRGYTGAANHALREWLCGTEPYVVIGSHDLHVRSDTLRLLQQRMEEEHDIGIAAPDMPEASYGAALDGGVEWVSGQAMMFRRECIRDIGGFDERFGSYVEDVDIGLRAWDMGWRVQRVSEAKAHGMGSSIGATAVRRHIWPNEVGLACKRNGVRGGMRELWRQLRAALREGRLSITDWTHADRHLVRGYERVRSLPAGVRRLFVFLRNPPHYGGVLPRVLDQDSESTR